MGMEVFFTMMWDWLAWDELFSCEESGMDAWLRFMNCLICLAMTLLLMFEGFSGSQYGDDARTGGCLLANSKS